MQLVFVYDVDGEGADFLGLYLTGGGNIELTQEVAIRAEEFHVFPRSSKNTKTWVGVYVVSKGDARKIILSKSERHFLHLAGLTKGMLNMKVAGNITCFMDENADSSLSSGWCSGHCVS